MNDINFDKFEIMKKLLFALCCLSVLCFVVSAQEPCPNVIPALQQWKGGKGKLFLPAEGSIVVDPAGEVELLSTARILVDDLRDLMNWNYIIKTGKPEKNDIYLSLTKPDKQLGNEGYILTTNRYATIEAPTVKGVFGEHVVFYKSYIISKVNCQKEQHVTFQNFLIVDLCWM